MSAPFHPRFPAEWEPQSAVWFSWPANPNTWPDRLHHIQAIFARMLSAVSQCETVRLNCAKPLQDNARRLLLAEKAQLDRIEFFDIPTNDVWCRDHGPTFVKDSSSGSLAIVDWKYNAWGGKFPPWDLDDAVPARIAEALRLPIRRAPIFCEGGGIESNGQGILLTTECVMLNPNRNPDIKKLEVENLFKEYLGIHTTFWLGEGMTTDDTDGHIDTLARFFKPDGIVAIQETNSKDPDYRNLQENIERIQGFRTPTGGRFDLALLPQPDPVFAEGTRTERLPATYANFLILNGAVLVPTYGQPKRDSHALGLLGELFPKRKIIGMDSLEILREGGSFHCLSQQQPA